MSENGRPCGAIIRKDELARTGAMRDQAGLWWCSKHRNRGELLNWAAEHKYPTITFPGKEQRLYTIGSREDAKDPFNADIWKAHVLCGSEDLISSALDYIRMGGHER